MSTTMLEAVRKTVSVGCDPERAFRLFTEGIASWWPVATHSLGGEQVTDVVFEQEQGGALYELAPSGRSDWGRVLEWEPGRRFLLEWLVESASGTSVEVTFSPDGAGTRVDLVHSGFSSAETRESYHGGWDVVLAPFAEQAGP